MDQSTEIAKLLLDIKAVTLNVQQPYHYTSGILSPIYCDNRLVISYPEKRHQIIDAFLQRIHQNQLSVDVIAGTATAGIPHAAWIADRLNKPMVYVRSRSKAHGKQNKIEGKLEKGQRALVIEDLISTGTSAVSAGLALRTAGAVVTDCIAIFSYQMTAAEQQFSNAGIRPLTLSNFSTLIEVAAQEGYINPEEKKSALTWNKDPEHWGR